jgi:hypothetical protein
VNGNLNLSRSLGDLKYKQSKHLLPSAQMITAEPDIRILDITEEDEFFILACDGIWDALTNQAACDFVRERVLKQHLSLDQVIHEVMKRCIANNPRESQGIGGDNMTFLLVWLQPSLLKLSTDHDNSNNSNNSTTTANTTTETMTMIVTNDTNNNNSNNTDISSTPNYPYNQQVTIPENL